MGTMYLQSDLKALETGLKDLKQCRLMRIEEFRDMYHAIEKHHRNMRLAHLTGQAPDLKLRTKEQRESLLKVHTWFQSNKHILHSGPKFGKEQIKKEVDEKYGKTTPRTPKSAGTARKSKTPRTPKPVEEKKEVPEEKPVVTRLTSAEGMRNFFKSVTPSTQLNGAETPQGFLHLDLPTHSDKVNEFLTSRFFMAGELTGFGRPPTTETPTNRVYFGDQEPTDRNPAIERFITSPNFLDGPDLELHGLDSPLGDLGEVEEGSGHTPAPRSSPREGPASVASQRYVESITPRSNLDIDPDEDDIGTPHSGHPEDDLSMPELRRKLSRGQTMSASIRGGMSMVSQEQSSNLSTYMPKKMIHPIASLVNPHAQLAAIEAQQAEQEYLASRENSSMSMRASGGSRMQYSASKNRPMSMTRQNTNLSSRPNTSHSVHPAPRPASVAGGPMMPARAISRAESLHSRAENLASWKNFNRDMAYGQDILIVPLTPRPTEVQEIYTQNSLEEFYQLTDGYYPPKLPKYHHPVVSKPKTPGSTKSDHLDPSSRATSAKTAPLGRDLLGKGESEKKEETPRRSQSEMKLTTVVNMIDTVSGEMNYFKEKLAPSPAPGFRQPSSTGVSRRPLSRPATASGRRSPSPIQPPPLQRTNSPSIIHGDLNSNINSNVVNKDLLLPSREPEIPQPKSVRSLSSQSNRTARAVDWRGRISPEQKKSLKWQRQKFGEHSFVKKLYPGKRPVGATHAGNRPKTAPMTVREKWKIEEKPNEGNIRVSSQAATNTMTLVDDKTMDNIMMVQPIEQWNTGLGSMNSIYLDENFLRSFSSGRYTPGTTVTATPIPMEYVPIVANAPKSLMESRTQSRQTRKSDRADSRFEGPSLELEDEGQIGDNFKITATDSHEDPNTFETFPQETEYIQTEDTTDRQEDNFVAREIAVQTDISRIPRPYHQTIGQDTTPRQGETYKAELEHHARKVKSPRHFMEQVVELRKGAVQSAPPGSVFVREDSLLGTSLQVCRLPTRSNGFGPSDGTVEPYL
ncbi:hypothetical protein FSP39_021820 [Pinctada imbricata]|uniref:Uncharacterized protein n=1 Tax=Pinctada imbricata TaxID=66713 RepID=A0AA88Y9U4_PINIB|nr:hypothetical protein FSP39_021820 [Pinctada imbricata]